MGMGFAPLAAGAGAQQGLDQLLKQRLLERQMALQEQAQRESMDFRNRELSQRATEADEMRKLNEFYRQDASNQRWAGIEQKAGDNLVQSKPVGGTINDAEEGVLQRTGNAGVLKAREVVLPPPGPGEARVAIEAAGVAYADIVMRQGLYPGVKAPVTPGYDFVGRIEALGAGVEGLSVGQRVAALTVTGSYASRRNIEVKWLVAAPEGADARALVAAVLNGLTAWQMFHRLAVAGPGEWVLIHGAAGGVGNLLLEMARNAGVRAIGTASAGKKAVVEARGGVHLDYATGDVAAKAREFSGGGVVAAYDHIGGKHL